LTQEEIETTLITNPDPQTPSHHQVNQRIIKAYLTGESVPTYLPGHLLPHHFGILPTYLPRDRFLLSELVVPLVHAQYHWDYHIWKHKLDENTRATDYLVDHRRISFAHIALLCGNTGPALESGLANQEFVIAFVCRFQVILSHSYINFPTIDDLRQILLDQYLRIGLEGDSRVLGPPDHPFRTVREGSSWEGGGLIQLPLIPQDSTIANNYRQFRDSEGIEMDSMRNPPRPVKRPRLGSFTSDSLFDEDSELSEGSEYTGLTLPLLDADHCNEMIVTDTFYGINQREWQIHYFDALDSHEAEF
jgi:hypothetical protein